MRILRRRDLVMLFFLCIICEISVSCNFLAFLVKMKDSMWREEFVSASLILTRLKRTLDLLVSFNQKNVRHFVQTIWPQARLQNVNIITAFSFVASPLLTTERYLNCHETTYTVITCWCRIWVVYKANTKYGIFIILTQTTSKHFAKKRNVKNN